MCVCVCARLGRSCRNSSKRIGFQSSETKHVFSGVCDDHQTQQCRASHFHSLHYTLAVFPRPFLFMNGKKQADNFIFKDP